MSENISKNFRLAIISDTSMYQNRSIYIFEPVFREINFLLKHFKRIDWIGYKSNKLGKMLQIDQTPSNLRIFPLYPSGGQTIIEKLKVIFFFPYYFIKILILILQVDIIFSRGPSIPALITILFSYIFPHKIFFHKYAGDWQIQSSTFSYRIQQFLLSFGPPGIIIVAKRNSNNPPNISSWINPCLTREELISNKKIGLQKNFNFFFSFCFVGRLEDSKGATELLKAINKLDSKHKIKEIHFAGENLLSKKHKFDNINNNIELVFHGHLHRDSLNKIYAKSHFIILPSESEGFPKVLAEASSFGCIPIIPQIPSIKEYISNDKKNGIELPSVDYLGIKKVIENLSDNRHDLNWISSNAIENARLFSYNEYYQKICNGILNIQKTKNFYMPNR